MVKLQLYLHLFFNNIQITPAELDCATLLAIDKFDERFFKKTVEKGIFKSEQSVRNCMSKLKSYKILVKEDKEWKINPDISLGVDDVICLMLKAKNNPE